MTAPTGSKRRPEPGGGSGLTPTQLRRSTARFATGVTVVSAFHPTAGIRAMTANSFQSVSLDPPLVMVSVNNAARMHAAIEAAGHYAVSVLREDQVYVAQHFAGRQDADFRADFQLWTGVPVLKDALARMSCVLDRAVVAGDHTLFLGSPTRLDTRYGAPLLFYGGEFRTIRLGHRGNGW